MKKLAPLLTGVGYVSTQDVRRALSRDLTPGLEESRRTSWRRWECKQPWRPSRSFLSRQDGESLVQMWEERASFVDILTAGCDVAGCGEGMSKGGGRRARESSSWKKIKDVALFLLFPLNSMSPPPNPAEKIRLVWRHMMALSLGSVRFHKPASLTWVGNE